MADRTMLVQIPHDALTVAGAHELKPPVVPARPERIEVAVIDAFATDRRVNRGRNDVVRLVSR